MYILFYFNLYNTLYVIYVNLYKYKFYFLFNTGHLAHLGFEHLHFQT